VSEAVTEWLTSAEAPTLSPFELANWLRTLPKEKIPEETKKAVARAVLERKTCGDDFQNALTAGHWADLGISDEREAATLSRYYRGKQREAAMAAAARESAAMNATFRNRKGEMLEC